jgi:hypothetical protein
VVNVIIYFEENATPSPLGGGRRLTDVDPSKGGRLE